jgi:hypothetical protein
MALVSRALIVVAIMIVLLLSSRPVNVTSQATGQLEPRFNQVIVQVHKAESAGATPEEIANLVALLNRALELNQQALALTRPEDAQNQTQLLSQVDQVLGTVQFEATQLELVAAQRTFTNNVLAYVSGGIAAILATIAYAYGLSFWRKYRVKRTFQMKVIPK